MTSRKFYLGAEELLELGNTGDQVMLRNRKPFLAGRVTLGEAQEGSVLDALASVAKFLAEILSKALLTVSEIVGVPLGMLAQGVEVAFNAVSNLLKKIPAIGALLAEAVLVGGVLIKFGLSIPTLALGGLGNAIGGIAQALGSNNSESDNQVLIDQARGTVINQSVSQRNVEKVLDDSGVTGVDLTPALSENGRPLAQSVGTGMPGMAFA